MKKTKMAPPAAEKAETIEKPFEFVKGEPGSQKMRHLMSADVKIEFEEKKFTPPKPGPMTAELQLTPGQYLERYATPDELRVFKAAVMARLAQEARTAWRTLPNGSRIRADQVLAGCTNPKCAIWHWIKPEHAGMNCLSCNYQNRVGGGKLRLATVEEEKAYLARETAAHKKWIADAPKRKAELDAFQKRHLEDML